MFTPAGSVTAPDVTVPSTTIVVPDLALLIADASDVPPDLTVICLLLEEELELEELDELLELDELEEELLELDELLLLLST